MKRDDYRGNIRPQRVWLTPSIIGLVAAYIILYLWQPGGMSVLNAVTDALSVIFALLAAWLAVKASRLFEPGATSRRAWLLFGAGMAAMMVAELVWAYYHDILAQTLPFPSPSSSSILFELHMPISFRCSLGVFEQSQQSTIRTLSAFTTTECSTTQERSGLTSRWI